MTEKKTARRENCIFPHKVNGASSELKLRVFLFKMMAINMICENPLVAWPHVKGKFGQPRQARVEPSRAEPSVCSRLLSPCCSAAKTKIGK